MTTPAPGRPLSHLVDGPTLRRAATAGWSGAPSGAERLPLDASGRHAFLPLEQLARFLGWAPVWTRRCRNRLCAVYPLPGSEPLWRAYRARRAQGAAIR